jgi:hypothetical protein
MKLINFGEFESFMTYEKRLLQLLAIGHIFAGLALFALFFMPFLHTEFLSLIYIGNQTELDTHNNSQLPFWICIFGPTLASWGVLLLALIKRYFAQPDRSLWWYFIAALCVWAPLDSLLCLMNGLYIGALLNALVLSAFLILWFRVRALAWNPL